MNRGRLIAAGLLLGMGLGGLVDGIVLHQILQVHNMLSARVPPNSVPNMELNMLWDGLFDAFTWIITAVGLAVLWNAGKQREASWSGATLMGGMIAGWGLFNVVEGLINHFILHLHHVLERAGLSAYDFAFIAVGILFILIGGRLVALGREEEFTPRPRSIIDDGPKPVQ
jgi:uncharacterized membrane protein